MRCKFPSILLTIVFSLTQPVSLFASSRTQVVVSQMDMFLLNNPVPAVAAAPVIPAPVPEQQMAATQALDDMAEKSVTVDPSEKVEAVNQALNQVSAEMDAHTQSITASLDQIEAALKAPQEPQQISQARAIELEPIVVHPASQEPQEPSVEQSVDIYEPAANQHTFEVGTEISKFEYEEPGLMRDKGDFYGIYGIYTFRPGEMDPAFADFVNMFRVEGRFSQGEVDYESNETGSLNGIDDYIVEVRGLAGRDLQLADQTTVTPYLGLGIRWLHDDSSYMRTTTGHLGYERESRYLYIPIGVEALKPLAGGWKIGGTLEYDLFIQGKQKSYLGYLGDGDQDIENTQNDGYGLRGSLKAIKDFGKISFVVEPFIRYWSIENSEFTPVTDDLGDGWYGGGIEPENNSTEVGLRLGAMF